MPNRLFLYCLAGVCFGAQSADTQTFDPRLKSSTILREDIFAGFMAHDQDRRSRGEKNVEILLAERPQDRPILTAWKAGIVLNRAVDANHSRSTDEVEREYRRAVDLFAEAARLDPANIGVMITQGAAFAAFSDLLPDPYRRDGWSRSYQGYSAVWRAQRDGFDKLPLHLKGELLAGMAQSAERSDHSAESAQFLQRILTDMPGTPYAAMAKKWVDTPKVAATTNLTCQTCHEVGRLEAQKASLLQQR